MNLRRSMWCCVPAAGALAILAAVAGAEKDAPPATGAAPAGPPWVVYDGGDGPGKGKKVVLISGDEEYRSEEALPQLGRILARRHGFTCTVLFAIDPASGEIAPTRTDNIPGLEALAQADLMIIATRFRNLGDAQMKPIDDYLRCGKPVIGLRTATHAFNLPPAHAYARYSWNSRQPKWEGGFGRVVLGETWIAHHGAHGKQSTRGRIAPPPAGGKTSRITLGCEDIWGPTDVYTVRLPLPGDSLGLVLGEVLEGMAPADKPAPGKKNEPMMPVAWTRTYQIEEGKPGKAFTTTMGSSTDLASEGLRRLLVNAAYWAVGMEEQIPPRADVDLVGPYEPTPFGFGKHKKGVKPADLALTKP